MDASIMCQSDVGSISLKGVDTNTEDTAKSSFTAAASIPGYLSMPTLWSILRLMHTAQLLHGCALRILLLDVWIVITRRQVEELLVQALGAAPSMNGVMEQVLAEVDSMDPDELSCSDNEHALDYKVEWCSMVK